MDRPSDAELRERLSPLQYDVTQNAATEYAFSGKFYKHKADGTYACIVCDAPLFHSDKKYDSGCGWPSFTEPVAGAIREIEDTSHGMRRIETRCARCDAHLGHVFDDGPRDAGGLRYCINSASLQFDGETG